jgi:hypothetical protein
VGGYTFSADNQKGLEHLISKADLSEQTREALKGIALTQDTLTPVLQAQEQTAETRLIAVLAEVKKYCVSGYIYVHILAPRQRQYLYFDEYIR